MPPLEINGEECLFYLLYKNNCRFSFNKLINNEKSFNEQEYISELPESEKINAVYYVDFDVVKISTVIK